MNLMPFPGADDDVFQGRELGFPAEFGSDLLTGTDQHGRIASAPRGDFYRDCMASDFTCCLDDLFHRKTLAIAKIVGVAALLKRSQSENVRLSEVADVDVVPYARTVGCVVVVAEDANMLSQAEGDLEDEWDEMQLGVVIFPPLLAGTSGIEITQTGVFHPVRLF